jgi:monofunctional glycosyltransferase
VARLFFRIWRWLLGLSVLAFGVLALAVAYDSLRPPVSTLMLGRMLRGEPVDRRWTPLSEISPNLAAAVLMSEDAQFCMHNGVDWDALHEVMSNPEGPSRGASTVPMQVAKNLFLWPGRSYIRKGLEIPMALFVDAIWTKRRILEASLNIAEWGDGIFGAAAASEHYFRKPPSRLSVREAALLATTLPNPALRNPLKPTRLQRSLTGTIVARTEGAQPWVQCLR